MIKIYKSTLILDHGVYRPEQGLQLKWDLSLLSYIEAFAGREFRKDSKSQGP